MTPPRWVVFGGSFDPPHRAHVELPRRAAAALGAEKVLYVPARINPLKQTTPPASPEDRLAMLRLALEGVPAVEIRTLELERTGPSFTVDTLRELAAEAAGRTPPARLVLLVGADTALGFPKWRAMEEIAELAEIVVMLRPPLDASAFREDYARAWREAGRPVPIEPSRVLDLGADAASSTGLREGGGDGLRPSVRAYIESHGLYR